MVVCACARLYVWVSARACDNNIIAVASWQCVSARASTIIVVSVRSKYLRSVRHTFFFIYTLNKISIVRIYTVFRSCCCSSPTVFDARHTTFCKVPCTKVTADSYLVGSTTILIRFTPEQIAKCRFFSGGNRRRRFRPKPFGTTVLIWMNCWLSGCYHC